MVVARRTGSGAAPGNYLTHLIIWTSDIPMLNKIPGCFSDYAFIRPTFWYDSFDGQVGRSGDLLPARKISANESIHFLRGTADNVQSL